MNQILVVPRMNMHSSQADHHHLPYGYSRAVKLCFCDVIGSFCLKKRTFGIQKSGAGWDEGFQVQWRQTGLYLGLVKIFSAFLSLFSLFLSQVL